MITWDSILGKTLLVGMTVVDDQGVETSRIQFHGVIIGADPNRGISLRIDGTPSLFPLAVENGVYLLPPDLRVIRPAPKGIYRLKSTNEVVVNPDLLSTWTLKPPPGRNFRPPS